MLSSRPAVPGTHVGQKQVSEHPKCGTPFGLGDELSADQAMAIIRRNPILAEMYQFARFVGTARAYEIAQRESSPVGLTEGGCTLKLLTGIPELI
jgi:hypothetical protein